MHQHDEAEEVRITLSADEALVLFEWLSNVEEKSVQLPFDHPVEQRVLWDLLCSLESALVAPFAPDYEKVLDAARERVEPGDGQNGPSDLGPA